MGILENISGDDGARPDDPGPPLSLADAKPFLPQIRAKLVAQLAARNITFVSASVDADSIDITVSRNGVQRTISLPKGWRGQGHLTSYPVSFLREQIAHALDPDADGGDSAAPVQP